MSAAALRSPRQPSQASPSGWFPSGLGISAGWSGNTVNAAYYNGKTYIGFCDGDGNMRVASFNHSTRAWALSPAIVNIVADAHCTPSVLVRSSDHKLVIAAANHNQTPARLYVAVSTNAEDVSAWGAATDISATLGGTVYTYANLFQLSGESAKVYLFYRDTQDTATSGALCYSTSTDGGATWAAQTTLYKNTGKQCYWAVGSDDTARIDFLVSDGTAVNSDAASVYHFYYTGGSFHKSDGTTISVSKPFAPANLTKIYDATNGNCRAPYAILTNAGNPCAVWAAYNSAGAGSNENYWYGSCSSGTWTVNQITDVGSLPDSTFSEGGLAIDATNPSRVLLAKKTSGVWQIFQYLTGNSGASWSSTQLSTDTAAQASDIYNLHPVTPRNAAAALAAVWCFGPNWALPNTEPSGAQIRGYPNPIKVF